MVVVPYNTMARSSRLDVDIHHAGSDCFRAGDAPACWVAAVWRFIKKEEWDAGVGES